MRIRTANIGRRERPLIDRIENITEQAIELVEGAMHARIGHMDLLVTDTRGLVDLLNEAERATVGGRHVADWAPDKPYGRTALTPSGVLVALNADTHRPGKLRELDVTLVHELVHAVQLSRPEVRKIRLVHLRNNYGVAGMTRSQVREANRQVEREERQARSLEHLARKLH
ncbi:hypothetical protein ACWGQ4_19695 [Streptomyces sp. NPDC055721]|uniref:hypothetical protein n=1 Tax=Streptomyces sp. NPDC127132 TaxID=3345374 RepID=UPI00363636FB